MATPDLMPILSDGAHKSPAEGACVMEMASHLAGEAWSDTPACTHPMLARAAQSVNDNLPDAERGVMLDLLPRLMGTTAGRNSLTNSALTAWIVGEILPLVDDPCGDARRAAQFVLEIANDSWVGIGGHAADAINYAGGDIVAYLTGLLDEYDRLTGRVTPTPLTADDTARLVALTH